MVGAARAMRARAVPVRVEGGILVDTCGTGGDGAGTINVSTIAALVAAACGVRVAKHGNRAQSSRAGSADLLEALGVDVAAPPAVAERCLAELGIGFFYAPSFHGATRHAAPVRREIGVRTLFNLLGPLTNPAGARRQVVGVFAAEWIEPVARALGALGAERALVVHGAGGLDEIAPAGPTEVAEWSGGELSRYAIAPADFGLREEDPAGLRGGDAAENAARARAILGGEAGAGRACVVMAAAAALYAAGEPSLERAARRAEEAIDGGAARALLDRLVAASRRADEAAG
jgi:anthranilate phosphoribosyltransferase